MKETPIGVTRLIEIIIMLCLMASSAPARQSPNQVIQQGNVKVTKIYQGEKRLDFQIVIPASPAEVWAALTTADGLKTWLAPDVKVELKPGGDWLAVFPGSTAGGTILGYVDGQSITISAMAPDSFPTVRRERTRAVFRIDPASDGKGTLLHLTQTGWKSGDEWDRAFEYLAEGNPMLLEMLRQRFISGPIDWAAMMKGPSK